MGGRNKALITVDGETIINRNLQVLREIFDEILLSGWPENTPEPDNVTVISDNFPDTGPLAGIEASLKAASHSHVFVFGGDMPWLSPEIIKSQLRASAMNPHSIIVPRTQQTLEPLHSIFPAELHDDLVRYILSGHGRAVWKFITANNHLFLDVDPGGEYIRAFISINRPGDLNCK